MIEGQLAGPWYAHIYEFVVSSATTFVEDIDIVASAAYTDIPGRIRIFEMEDASGLRIRREALRDDERAPEVGDRYRIYLDVVSVDLDRSSSEG